MNDWIPLIIAVLALAVGISAALRSRYWARQAEAAAERSEAAARRAAAAAGLSRGYATGAAPGARLNLDR